MVGRHVLIIIVTIGIIQLFYNPQYSFGQRSKRSAAEKPDNVELRCLYRFSQKVGHGDGFIVAVDSMMLEMGNSYSVYYNWLEAHKDSVYKSKQPDISSVRQLNIVTDADAFATLTTSGAGSVLESVEKRETTKIYKDRNEKIITTIEKDVSHLGIQYLKCTESISMEWDISPDTLTVAGYLCQKATGQFRGRNYNVWFTAEIPINDGPWKLYGLPGLILKAEDDEGFFEFLAVGLEKASGIDAIVMENNLSIKSDYKQIERARQNRLSIKSVMHSDNGNITTLKMVNPLRYNPLERD